jgi:hypothetical protein
MPHRMIVREIKAMASAFRWLRDHTGRACFYIVFAMVLLSPFEYWAVLSIPDSTDYFLQEVSSAKEGPDGRDYIYVGDDLQIKAYNWRHKTKAMFGGTCWIWVDRVRENVGGKHDKQRTVIQGLAQQFSGDGIIRRTTWPVEPARITITPEWFDDPEVDEQEMDIFTTGYFICNPLDRIRYRLGIERMHHNAQGEPERERTRVVLRRKPT